MWPGTLAGYRAMIRLAERSGQSDRLRLRPTLALRDIEFDPLALLQAAVTIHHDGGVVHEHVPATVDRDEAVALVRVEPLDGALSHLNNSLTTLGLRIPPLLRETRDRGGPSIPGK